MTEKEQNQTVYKVVQDFLMDKSFDLISAACTLQRLAGRMEQLADLVGNDEGAKDKVAILTRIRAVEILEELRSKIDILGKSK